MVLYATLVLEKVQILRLKMLFYVAVLAEDAIKAALKDYKTKRDKAANAQ